MEYIGSSMVDMKQSRVNHAPLMMLVVRTPQVNGQDETVQSGN